MDRLILTHEEAKIIENLLQEFHCDTYRKKSTRDQLLFRLHKTFNFKK